MRMLGHVMNKRMQAEELGLCTTFGPGPEAEQTSMS